MHCSHEKAGHEREAAVCLMQKFFDLRSQGQDLQIRSAVALDHLKGYLYVEADKEAYVKQVWFVLSTYFNIFACYQCESCYVG